MMIRAETQPKSTIFTKDASGRKMVRFPGIVGLDFVRQSLNGLCQSHELSLQETERSLSTVDQIEATVTDLFTRGGLLKRKGILIQPGIDDIPLPPPLRKDIESQALICNELVELQSEYPTDPPFYLPDFSETNIHQWAYLIGKNFKKVLTHTLTPGGYLDFSYKKNKSHR